MRLALIFWFLKRICIQAAGSLQGDALLGYYVQEWEKYFTGAAYLNRLFTYLNRHWIKQEQSKDRTDVFTVDTVCIVSFCQHIRVQNQYLIAHHLVQLALHTWKTVFFTPAQGEDVRSADTVLSLVERQRNGETEGIDQGLIKVVLDSLVKLGVDASKANPVS